jgi:hypothetical protein
MFGRIPFGEPEPLIEEKDFVGLAFQRLNQLKRPKILTYFLKVQGWMHWIALPRLVRSLCFLPHIWS